MLGVARVVFALLVCATVGAFFVTQRLKREPTVVNKVRITKFVSPNGDGVRDKSEIRFTLKENDDVTVSVIDSDEGAVRELVAGRRADAFTPVQLIWDGKTDDGLRAADGQYRVRIGLRRQGRSVIPPGPIVIDTKPPKPLISRRRPEILEPGRGEVLMAVRGAGRRVRPIVEVWRTDVRPARKLRELTGKRGRRRVVWDGLDEHGEPAPPGTYLLVPVIADRAGNVGTTPSRAVIEDPTAIGRVPGQAGVTIRHLSAHVPLTSVRGGARVEVFVDSRGRRYSWRLRRIGTRRPRLRGQGKPGEPLRFRAPGGVSAAYLLQLRSGPHGVDLPILVQSQRRADVLVVLPAATWIGEDTVDDDYDGLPDSLSRGRPVSLGPKRVLDGLPADFASEIAPALVFLDRAGLRYDLTTDIEMSGGTDPRPTDRPGVLLLGRARWQPTDVARRLRRYVLAGGRLALLGTDELRSSVKQGRRQLLRPTASRAIDLFGARLRAISNYSATDQYPSPPDLVAGGTDQIGLLTGIVALPGAESVERVAAAGARAKSLASLVQETRAGEVAPGVPENPNDLTAPPQDTAGEPVVLAARFGKGTLVRTGLPDLAQKLCADANRAQLVRNTFDILRGVKPKLRDAGQGCGAEPKAKPAPRKKKRRAKKRSSR